MYQIGDYVRVKHNCEYCGGYAHQGDIAKLLKPYSSSTSRPRIQGRECQVFETNLPNYANRGWIVCEHCIEAVGLDELPENQVFARENKNE